MVRLYSMFAVLLLAFQLSGCATVNSRPAEGTGTVGNGIAYNLPEGTINVQLLDDNGKIFVVLANGAVAADPEFQIDAAIPHGAFSDNDVKVEIDGNNLLKSVTVTSSGRVDDILNNLLKSVIAIQSTDEASGVVIFDRDYRVSNIVTAEKQDADTAETVVSAMENATRVSEEVARQTKKTNVPTEDVNAFLQTYYQKMCGRFNVLGTGPFIGELRKAGYTPQQEKEDLKARLIRCSNMAFAGLDSAVSERLVEIGIAQTRYRSLAVGEKNQLIKRMKRKCRTGICYRPRTSIEISVIVKGLSSKSATVTIPDPTRVNYVPMRSGLFETQVYTLTFDNGVLNKYDQNSKSELVGLAELPFKLIKTAITTPGEMLGLKANRLQSEADYLKKLEEVQSARESGRELCENNPDDCTKTARKILEAPMTPTALQKSAVPDADKNVVSKEDKKESDGDTNTSETSPLRGTRRDPD